MLSESYFIKTGHRYRKTGKHVNKKVYRWKTLRMHILTVYSDCINYKKSAITLCLISKNCFCLLELLSKKNLVQNFQNDLLVNRNIFGFTVIHLWHPGKGKVQKSKLKLGKWRMRMPEEWEVENWHVWTTTHKKPYIYLCNFYGLFCSLELLKKWDEAIITVVPK